MAAKNDSSSEENDGKETTLPSGYHYGWYTMEQLAEYYDQLIGAYGAELEKHHFDDAHKTNYREALHYVAQLVWNEYHVKQSTNHPDPDSAMVNLDALHTVLLSLHPTKNLGEYELSDFTREGLAELQHFHNLILLGPHTGCDGQGARSAGPEGHHADLHCWVRHLPTTYTAQLALMGWFLTLTSKMTGHRIPGVGMAAGGEIEQERADVSHYLEDMEILADVMEAQGHWRKPQFSILWEMYVDLKKMYYSHRHNRDCETGKFRPMAEVMGPDWKPQTQKKGKKDEDEVKFPASRGSRREFPTTEGEYRKGQQLNSDSESEEL